MSEELANMQSRIAFQEDAIETLSQMVAKQDREIQELKQQLQMMHKKMEEVTTAIEDAAEESFNTEVIEKPPHY